MFFRENEMNNIKNKKNGEIDNDLENIHDNNYQYDNKLINEDNIKTNDNFYEKNPSDLDFNKKYDEESNYIDKENRFYDFNEQFLEYRSLEAENLAKSLLDLKSAIILTSRDRKVEDIIDYSNSEKTFSIFKNKEGAIICQSNIGNLQSQLLKFDKAIYHLALSLQDNKLLKFLSQNLRDELDEEDSLLKKISYTFNKNKKRVKNNILIEKQINNSKKTFSKKIIGIMINTRYCRLIYALYIYVF